MNSCYTRKCETYWLHDSTTRQDRNLTCQIRMIQAYAIKQCCSWKEEPGPENKAINVCALNKASSCLILLKSSKLIWGMVPCASLFILVFSVGNNFGITLFSVKKKQTHAHCDSIVKMYLKVKLSELKTKIFRGKKEKWKSIYYRCSC